MYEEFSNFIKQKTGWSLKVDELSKLYTKYADPHTKRIDYNLLVRDLRDGVNLRELSTKADMNPEVTSKQNRHLSIQEVISLLRKELFHRLSTLKGENNLTKSYLLFGESHSPILNKEQFKLACQIRLSVYLSDAEIQDLFHYFDIQGKGFLQIRELINLLLFNNKYYDPNDPRTSSSTTPLSSAAAGGGNGREEPHPSAALSLPIGEKNNSFQRSRPTSAAAATTTSKSSTPSENARISYDKKFLNLIPPDIANCKSYSNEELETIIWHYLTDRSSSKNQNNKLKTLIKLFSDGEVIQSEHIITLNQMRFTFWKRLQLNITDSNILQFFLKFSKDLSQPIRFQDFANKIIRERSYQENQPLLDDRSQMNSKAIAMDTANYSSDIDFFLIQVRSRLNDLINRESRAAPHYLLHGTSKMTEIQAKLFFKNRLHLMIDSFPEVVMEKVYREYKLPNGLLDVKRMLLEAMVVKDGKLLSVGFNVPNDAADDDRTVATQNTAVTTSSHVVINSANYPAPSSPRSVKSANSILLSTSNNRNNDDSSVISSATMNTTNTNNNNNKAVASQNPGLLNGAMVSVSEMPITLNKRSYSPEEIEVILSIKCQEKLRKGSHPHASLYRIFRESDGETRIITKEKLWEILTKFDILLSIPDFTAFFEKHNRGDNRIDVKKFLQVILPPILPDENPFTPKDDATMRKELLLAKVLEEITGKRKEVSYLTGPNYTRVEKEFIQQLDTQQQQQSQGQSGANGLMIVNSLSQQQQQQQSYQPRPPSASSSGRPKTADAALLPNDRNKLEFADTLLSAMKDLEMLSHVPPHSNNNNNNNNNNKEDQGNPDSPLYSVKQVDLSPRRPSTAPTRSTPTYKTRQLAVNLNNGATSITTSTTRGNTTNQVIEQQAQQQGLADQSNNNYNNNGKDGEINLSNNNSIVLNSSNSGNNNRIVITKKQQNKKERERPKSASHVPTQPAKLFADEHYRKIQREHLLALADAYASVTPDMVSTPQQPQQAQQQQFQVQQDPNYPLIVLDQTQQPASNGLGIKGKPKLMSNQREGRSKNTNRSSAPAKSRPSSAPPTRAYYYYSMKDKYTVPDSPSHHSSRDGVVSPAQYPIPVIVPHRAAYTPQETNQLYEQQNMKAITPVSRGPPATAPAGTSRSNNNKLSSSSRDHDNSSHPSQQSPRSARTIYSYGTLTPRQAATLNFRTPDEIEVDAQLSKKFVNSYLRQEVAVDPTRDSLRDYYKFSSRGKKTTNEIYGVYVSSLKKASKNRKKMYDQQKKMTVTVRLNSPSTSPRSQQ